MNKIWGGTTDLPLGYNDNLGNKTEKNKGDIKIISGILWLGNKFKKLTKKNKELV